VGLLKTQNAAFLYFLIFCLFHGMKYPGQDHL